MTTAGHNLAERAIPYTIDGLVAMYDGIWNEGVGEHNPLAQSWKNLAADNELLPTIASDAVVPPLKDLVWCDNGIDGDQGIGLRDMTPSAIIDAVNNKRKLSYDVCFTSKETAHTSGYFSLFGIASNVNNVNNNRIGLCWVNQQASFRFYADANKNKYLAYGNVSLAKNFFSVNIDYEDMQAQLFVNGALWSSQQLSNIPAVSEKSGLQVFFLNTVYYSAPIYGDWPAVTFHALRIYDKIRSQDEVKHNYLIDKERFGV